MISTRPPLPALSVGDELVMVSGTPGRRDGQRATAVKVVIVGRKYVHVIPAEHFDDYEPTRDKWRLRRFLLADGREGEPGRRFGYTAHIATAEQRVYDLRQGEASEYLSEQGIQIAYDSPWHRRRVELADLLRQQALSSDHAQPSV